MKEQKQIPQNIDLNDILMKMKTRIQFEDFFQKAGKHKYLKKWVVFPRFLTRKQRLCISNPQK